MSSNTELVNSLIERFVKDNSVEMSIVLLQIVSYPEQGGQGYRIEMFNPLIDMDGWEVDHDKKVIKIDSTGLITNYTIADYANSLKEAIETEFLKTRQALLPRILWGTGKVILGLVETTVGLIGVIVPEPGTTVAGIVVVTLGANNIVDGLSQLGGANQGYGVNLLSEGSGFIGSKVAEFINVDPTTGYNVGTSAFLITSIAAGSLASIKILNVRGRAFIGTGVGGQPGGVYLGRLSGLYTSSRAADGMTIININNNSGQYILRFVTHGGQLTVNGRIIGVQRVLNHSTDAKEILLGLLKLLAHGAKF